MKKKIACALSIALLICLLGCSGSPEGKSDTITISFDFGERTGMYDGNVDDAGLPDGTGTFSSQTESGASWTYVGDWDHGHWNGQGMTKWETGESYCGYYSNDELGGYGVYTYPDGSIYAGYFGDGVQNGYRIYTTMEGFTFIGNFDNGVPEGYCAIYLNDGSVFWGNYINGEAEGILYLVDGSTVAATHKNGNLRYYENEITKPSAPESSYTHTNNDERNPTQSTTDPTISSEETTPKIEVTAGMKNALKSAQNYLSIIPFSYKRLVEQLEYEEYTHEEAVYAADNCNADWYEQAKKTAKSYLDIMGFSRAGLINQLEHDGFTHEQAVYGVEQNGL